MSLLYRAVWDDEWCDPLAVLDDEFHKWCASKGVDVDDIPVRGRHVVDDAKSIEIRRADSELGRALRCTMTEADVRGRTWTTTATALADDDTRTFWVDLDCHDPSGRAPEMAAPRLVRGMIDNGGRPTSFGVELTTTARRINESNVDTLVTTLLDDTRTAPLVVFSPDRDAGPPETVERADVAAEALAGIAHVYAVDPRSNRVLDDHLPHGFRVYGGAVRLYLPGLRIDDPEDSHRHRWIAVRLIRSHPHRAAAMLASRLARLRLHQPIPEAWERLEFLLRRPTEGEVGARATQITSSRSAFDPDADADALRREIDDLTKLLAEADLIREADSRDARAAIERLTADAARTENERYDDAAELEALRRECDGLRSTIRELRTPLERAPDEPIPWRDVDVPTTTSDAVDLARGHLPLVCIPEGALRELDELDSSPKYQVWASTVWQGLCALHEYAEVKATGERPAGFLLWCQDSGAWPSNKLAMTESETVTSNATLRDQRRFPVHDEVDSSGRLHMFAHLKVQAGGGDNIPRVYFHDDTDGPTGKMHVGFIGPHRYVRNTRS
jgi:hypothetical protein